MSGRDVGRWRTIGSEQPDDKSVVLVTDGETCKVCLVHLTWPESGSTYHFLDPDTGVEFEGVTYWADLEIP